MDSMVYLVSTSTGSTTTPIVNLTGYANSTGTGKAMLRLDWQVMYMDGTLGAVTIQHSDDASTWATLASYSLFPASGYKYFHTFKPFIRVTGAYTVGSSDIDNGIRLQLSFSTYGLPDWGSISICRPEDLRAVFPTRTETGSNFPSTYPRQMQLAKTHTEGLLRQRNIDPNKLFTDGHNDSPTVSGLRMAGAFLTWWYVGLDSQVVYSDSYKLEQEMLEVRFKELFEVACNGGLLSSDEITDAAKDPIERIKQPISCYR